MKVSFALALSQLARIVEQVEFAGGEVSDELIPAFSDVEEQLSDAVDRRILLIRQINSQLDLLSNLMTETHARKKALLRISDKIKERTADYARLYPDVTFKGTLGEIKINRNGGIPGIEYHTKLQQISNVIDPSDAHKIPEKYLEKTTLFVLKKEEFEKDLRAGNLECEAASLKQRGEHVRFG